MALPAPRSHPKLRVPPPPVVAAPHRANSASLAGTGADFCPRARASPQTARQERPRRRGGTPKLNTAALAGRGACVRRRAAEHAPGGRQECPCRRPQRQPSKLTLPPSPVAAPGRVAAPHSGSASHFKGTPTAGHGGFVPPQHNRADRPQRRCFSTRAGLCARNTPRASESPQAEASLNADIAALSCRGAGACRRSFATGPNPRQERPRCLPSLLLLTLIEP